jgi:hypothetical protein
MSIASRVSLSNTLYRLIVAFHGSQVVILSARHRKVIFSMALLHETRVEQQKIDNVRRTIL